MSIRKPHLVTQEGLERIQQELEVLRTTRREEVAARLQRAMEDGQDDEFVDNAELESARNDQSFLEGRIIELEEIVRYHEIIEETDDDSSVRVGSWVTVKEEGEDEEERYHLVGAAEANPLEGRISNESPLGKALLGAAEGDTVTYTSPGGEISFKIVDID